MKRISSLFSILWIAVLLCVVSIQTAGAKNVTTRLKAPGVAKTMSASKAKRTSRNKGFSKVSDAIIFMAYDKRGSADKETFFVDNGADIDLQAIELEITYYNDAGKQIDRRLVELNQSFPAKETRKVDIQSWDKQKSFHYINSLPSKSSIPYTVRFKLISYTPLVD